MKNGKIILTASSMACALRCPRRYWYDNILGLTEENPSEALRIGTAVHNGGEARAKGLDGTSPRVWGKLRLD